MSKNKRRQKPGRVQARRTKYPRSRLILVVFIIATFLGAGVILAQRSRNGGKRSAVAPTDVLNPSKEYVFVGERLVATEEPWSSSLPAPMNVVATAVSATQVTVNWSPSSGAASYTVQRAATISGSYNPVGSNITATNFLDSSVPANATFLYRVIAVDSLSNQSPPSASDIATTIIFADDPLIARSTAIRAQHILDLRQAVIAARFAANLSTSISWTDPSLSGVPVKAVHINEIRSNITPAIQALTGNTPTYTTPTLTPHVSVISAVDIQEIRNLVK